MPPRKGLSLEEKRTRMLQFFHETEGVFLLKEVEKRCSKEKGITPMAIKDVLQSLVDDFLVDTEKIGTSNYFWSFPSKCAQLLKRKHGELEEELEEKREKIARLEEAVAKEREGREESDERKEMMEELAAKTAEAAEREAELQLLADCDPDVVKKQEQEGKVALEAANRWTDNVLAIRSWANRKFNVEESAMNKHFGIPADFDYLE